MDLELAGKTALLVGGLGTLGQACAEALTAEGANVVIADLAAPEQAHARQYVPVDITSEASVRSAVDQAVKQLGEIDILVTLAGLYQGGAITEISAEDWNRILNVNLTGTFLVCREVLPRMQRHDYGRILCIASLAGQVGGVVAGANYSASKAGVLSLVKSLAKQSEKPWITVNAINPGPVESTMTDAWPVEQREQLRQKIPLRRFATPKEIAAVVCFLASPLAGGIHGTHLDVNGGLYMD